MFKPKVFVIGAGGAVGATAASALAIQGVAHEIVLVDIAQELVEAHATDINHSAAYTHGVRVRAGDYGDISEDDIIVVTCGAPNKSGGSRLDLLRTNYQIIREVMDKIKQQGKQVFVLMVSNPVDVLTHVALKVSGLPKGRVFGTGTTLDTARLRVMLAERLGVSQRHVHAHVFGEHGDSSFPALAAANVAGIPLKDFSGFSQNMVDNIADDVRQAAYKIVAAKTASKYGIGNVVAQIVAALMHKTKSIYPVCSLAQGEYGLDDIAIGLPSFVSSQGVEIIKGYPFSASEQKQLAASADVVSKAIQDLG